MKKALVIEDNEINLKLITYALARDGYEVIYANCGQAGIEQALKHIPDLIILDVGLPDMNGLEVAAQLKNNESVKDIPVVVITSFALKGDRERILETGVNGYFEKPINPLRIMEDINSIISG